MTTFRRTLLLAAALIAGAAACEPRVGRRPGESPGHGGGAAEAGGSGPPADTPLPLPPADTGFAALVAALSEPGGYFDTDNLISNEASYLHVIGDLAAQRIRGGVYLGVGPDQNFSYIAAVRPVRAFIVDIRRDNLLQHLWFRALFEASPSRLDYLCLMVLRRCGGPSGELAVHELVARVDAAPAEADQETVIAATARATLALGLTLDSADLETIRGIHRRFAAAGLDLRFNTHGRPPRSYYPTLRQLILERDRRGRPAAYLSDEHAYAFVRGLQTQGRIVPVVGDLAGPHAVRAIASLTRARGEDVSAFYVSNVEFYLFDDGTFPSFFRNLAALPWAEGGVLIRSVFRSPRPLPGAVPGYASTQMLHDAPALLRAWEQGRIRSYDDLLASALSN